MAEPAIPVGVELGRRGTIRVSGSERKTWLGRLLTADVAALEPAIAQHGLLLTQQGKIVSDAWIVDAGRAVLLGTAAERAAALEEGLASYLIMEDVELADESGAHVWHALHGAGAGALAGRVAAALGGTGARLDFAGTEGGVLIVPSGEQSACAAALRAEGVRLLDQEQWNTWRVRHGLALFGVDYGSDDRPHEAGLDRSAVSWTKGCYLGQEVVCMQDMRGKVKRRLALLRVAGVEPVAERVAVEHAGSAVGEVTSAAHDSGETFVIARMKAPFFVEPARLSIGGRDAELVASPLSPEPAR